MKQNNCIQSALCSRRSSCFCCTAGSISEKSLLIRKLNLQNSCHWVSSDQFLSLDHIYLRSILILPSDLFIYIPNGSKLLPSSVQVKMFKHFSSPHTRYMYYLSALLDLLIIITIQVNFLMVLF